MNNLINLVAMQIGWFACVLGAANQMPWLGPIVAVVVAAWHLARTSQPAAECKLIVCAVFIGLGLDSALASNGLISFTSGTLIAGWTTPWMLGLWIGFAITLNASLHWLIARPLLAMLFGALGGPAAYWSGTKLGAMTLHDIPLSLFAIGIGWTLAMGLFVLLTRYLNDTPPVQAVSA